MGAESATDFMLTTDIDGNIRFLSLSAIRVVDEVRGDHCRLWYSETHSVNLEGSLAAALLQNILPRTTNPKGQRLDWLSERIAATLERGTS